MPKKVSKIPAFDKGIISNPPARDIPEGAFSFADNVDTRVPGRVRGIRGEDTVNIDFNARVMAALLGETDYLVGQYANGDFATYDIVADTITVGGNATNFAKTFVTQNQQVYASMTSSFRGETATAPLWFGKVNETSFGGSGGFILEDAEVKSFADQQKSGGAPLITLGDNPGTLQNNEVAVNSGGESETFNPDHVYFYAVSLLYDGFQESPLIFGEADTDILWNSSVSKTESAHQNLLLRVSSASLPDRVTGFKVYRAKSTTSGDSPNTLYKLVKIIDDLSTGADPTYSELDPNAEIKNTVSAGDNVIFLDDVSAFIDNDMIKIDSEIRQVETVIYTDDSLRLFTTLDNAHSIGTTVEVGYEAWLVDANANYDYFYRIQDDGSTGSTYTDNTGIAETLETTSVNYELAVEYNGYMFVCGATKADIDNSESYIFRSQPKAFSMFDWPNDFTILPERPVAMAGFNGRLYAFGPSNMYRINPLSLEIEDTYHGVGALNENCVITTNFGMFHADDSNIYLNDGRTSRPIGTPILEMDGGVEGQSGWTQANKTDVANELYASLAFDPPNKRLLCFISIGNGNTGCWAFDVEFKVWSYFDGYPCPTTSAVGPEGTLYSVIGDTTNGFNLKSLFTNDTRKLWTVRTKDFDLGSDSGDFYAYDLHGYGNGNFVIKYLKDGGAAASPGTSTVDGLRKMTVPDSDKKMKSIAVEVAAAAASDELDNLTIQLRPQIIQE